MSNSSKTWTLWVDTTLCCNCGNCVMSVKDEYVGNTFPGVSAPQPDRGAQWFRVDRHVRGGGSQLDVTYVPRTCQHCASAPCVAAGRGAVRQRDDGIVVIDPVAARGRRDLVEACPYGAIEWNDALQLPQHWPFDAHLLDAGMAEPRCVNACPTGALRAERLDAATRERRASEEGYSPLQPQANTKPRVLYKGIDRLKTVFVAGNVSARRGEGIVENLEGAEVVLRLGGGTDPVRTRTDVWGDFRLDGLSAIGQPYSLEVVHPVEGGLSQAGQLDDCAVLSFQF